MPRASRRRTAATVVAAAALTLPRLVAACPACAGQEPVLSDVLKVVGAFLLVPFLVAAARCSSAAHEVASNPPPLLECVQPSFNKHLDRLHANLVRGLEDSAVRYNTTAAWILSEDE